MWTDLDVVEDGVPLRGTDGGILVVDQVHDLGARISLERNDDSSHHIITCGIYEWMMHSRYLSVGEDEARAEFTAMREALDGIIARIPNRSDPDVDRRTAASGDEMSAFAERFP
ncbi:MAG TPA: hypothetical protein VHL34_01805 [Rhizomicrobium sp.]|jgi:hypothetical protein|nr:hypothetical protein [Rhizomicrobium sp.]